MHSIASRQPEHGRVCDTCPAEDAFVIIPASGGTMNKIYLLIIPASIIASHLVVGLATFLVN